MNFLQAQIDKLKYDITAKPFIANDRYYSEFHKPKENFDYLGFMEVFRDSKLIKEWQKFYLDFFEGRKNILDIGCGKGEFLELLAEKGIQGVGIDSNADVVKFCKKKGLNVILGDFDDYLSILENNSLDGVFAAQLIEHLSLEKLNNFFKLCWLKLKPGGVLIVETPNPHCFPSFKVFSLDPTHVRPLFPEFAIFLFASNGFGELKLFYVNPIRNKHVETKLTEISSEFPDYTIIGEKLTLNDF